ncbi:MAG: phosphocarrier protein Chr [Bacillales bacterium]|jgi:catabolite repression HPr-like protein|nr:phosphocarrier protein Chr [Bacillales bacterium]
MEKKVTVNLKSGLQARAASSFVQSANRFQSDVYIQKNNIKVNAKSIMGLMSLGLARGSEIIIFAEGHDEAVAIEELARLVSEE